MSTLTKDLTVKVSGCLNRIPCDRLPDFDNLVGRTDGYQMGATSGFTPLGLRRQGLSPFHHSSSRVMWHITAGTPSNKNYTLQVLSQRESWLVGPHLGTTLKGGGKKPERESKSI